MTSPLRAALYVRLSRESEVSTSIAGQNADLYALADREGWRIVATFEDNGKSGGKQRDKALAALDMLRNNEADVLAVYAYDRWSRMGIADSAELLQAVQARQLQAAKRQTPPPLFVAAREGIRSDQEDWEMRVAFAADIAKKERMRMVDRRKASIERMRQAGRNPGTGPAPFGYRSAPFADGRPGRRFVVDHDEAELIREIAARLVDGESSSALARELNARKVPMPRSAYRLAQLKGLPTTDAVTGESLSTGAWTQSRVSQIWVSEHLLGRIMHKTEHVEEGTNASRTADERQLARTGVAVLDPATGLPLQAFDPVLDLGTVLDIRKRFAGNRGRGQQRKRRAARLLSGLVFCAVCESPMYVQSVQTGYAYYRCSGPSRGKDCTNGRANASWLEPLVVEKFLSTFGRLRAFKIEERRGAPEIDDAITALTEQIGAVARALADETADVPALLAQRSELIDRRSQLRQTAPTTSVTTVDLGATWRELFDSNEDVDTRRTWLASAFDHVTVGPRDSAERVLYFTDPMTEDFDSPYAQDDYRNAIAE